MNKNFFVFLGLILIFNINLYSDIASCGILYNRDLIDYDIKSNKGWYRVCKKNKIDQYLYKEISYSKKRKICDCIKGLYRSDIEITKGAFDDNK